MECPAKNVINTKLFVNLRYFIREVHEIVNHQNRNFPPGPNSLMMFVGGGRAKSRNWIFKSNFDFVLFVRSDCRLNFKHPIFHRAAQTKENSLIGA